jgi:uncharacterized protein
MFKTEVRDAMRIDWDVRIVVDDGAELRADVFRPILEGRYPALVTYGPYAKGLPFQVGYPSAWNLMADQHPDVTAYSTNQYQNWEVVDPEKWVPRDYVCVRVDSRGTGRSPGYIDHFSPRESQDLFECIEWAAAQSWCNGKVGINGISYYAINQWHVASLQPPHLAAMCIWEGAADWYRDMTHHGGILSTFWDNWYDMQVRTVQFGIGEEGGRNPITGQLICGDEILSDEALTANRSDFGHEILAHPFDDEYHRDRSPRWDRVVVPFLSSANWGGQGLHPRGNFEGFYRAASPDKWLEVHGREHWTHFYTDYGRELQLRFFDHFLKDSENDWLDQPRVSLQIRRPGEVFEPRAEEDWPIPRTQWTPYYLHPDMSLRPEKPGNSVELSFDALGEGLTFSSVPLEQVTEFTGPLASKLWISSTTIDADLFLVFRVFDSSGFEVTFKGAIDPHTPIAQGWLRASHRKLDTELSRPFRPYHTHDESWPLAADEVYEVEVEIWPTSIVVPTGFTVALSVLGHDYEWDGDTTGIRLSNFKNELRGCGPFLHDDPRDRPPDIFAGTTTLHIGPDRAAYVLTPVIPTTTAEPGRQRTP